MSDLANALRAVGDLINDLGLVTTAAAVVVLLVTLFGAVFAFKVAGLLADTYTVKVADNAFRWLVDRIVAIGVVLSRPGPAGGCGPCSPLVRGARGRGRGWRREPAHRRW